MPMDKKHPIVAICYDFDGTLAPGNMQEYGIMRALKTTPKSFWEKSDNFAKEHCADKNLAYMKTMLQEAKAKKIPLTKETLAKFGEDIKLFKGVEEWFSRINDWACEIGVEVQHYLISSGLKEIVAGTSIADEFTKVYACSFAFDENGVAEWPAQSVNYTVKTQHLFRIHKGCLDEMDVAVNERTPDDENTIPFTNMMYIGDGLTDVPCMATLRSFGGSAIAVYRPHTKAGSTHATKLLNDDRVDNIAPADYSDGSRMDTIIKSWILKIKADYDFKH
ncbi:MAG: haloacid dehalogenase-like hydrolase [Alphaproteobacteria bacterium]|nr:haloacid dehalogenase-like hydrolase [Alphaproteobacteria bacterium]